MRRTLTLRRGSKTASFPLAHDLCGGNLSAEFIRLIAPPNERSAERHKRDQSSQECQVIPDWELRPQLNVYGDKQGQDNRAEHPPYARLPRRYKACCRAGGERRESAENQ